MALLLAWVVRELNRDFVNGLCLGLALFVLIPRSLRIETSGVIPELTFDRFLLVTIFIYWLKQDHRPIASVPFLRVLIFLAAANLISLLLSVQPAASFKNFLSFIIEGLGFYIIVSTSLTEKETIQKALVAICSSLFIVASLAFIEKYFRINLSSLLIAPEPRLSESGVTSTYPHRILFGYAMAMGLPLMLVLTEVAESKLAKFLSRASIIVVVACYFSVSRGPWLGMLIGLIVIGFAGTRPIRRKLVIILVLAIITLIAKPGVRETIENIARSTFDEQTGKGKSYEYRWTLWKAAWSEIRRSSVRTLVGYGGGSTESMNLEKYFERQAGGSTVKLGYTSWDNNYACNLIEFGLVGFLLEAGLYLAVLSRLAGARHHADFSRKPLLAAVTAAAVVYLFAMSNVYIFSPQLKFLFWTLVAFGMNLRRSQLEEAGTDAAMTDEAEVFAEEILV